MNQPNFDWNADCNLPTSGLSPASLEASASAAQAVFDRYGERVTKVLTAFRLRGKLTREEASAITAMAIQSICSVFGKLQEIGWIEGTGEFFTYTMQGKYPRVVRRQYMILTSRGLEAASYFRSKA